VGVRRADVVDIGEKSGEFGEPGEDVEVLGATAEGGAGKLSESEGGWS
jgi:hypothetical protein